MSEPPGSTARSATPLRVHPTSRGLDPAALTAGRDLVLDIAPAHGLRLPDGVLADDHLDQPARWEIHRGGLSAVARCRELLDAALTVDGLCLPWLWELAIERSMVAVLGQAEALRRALQASGAGAIVLVGAGDRTRAIAAAVAAAAAIEVTERPAVAAPSGANAPPPASAARRRAVAAARAIGIPSRLRRGSTLFVSYWPLMALLDRMLTDAERRPAVMLRNPPTGPGRTLRAAARGGWIGTPGPAARRRAERAAAAAITAATSVAPPRLGHVGSRAGSGGARRGPRHRARTCRLRSRDGSDAAARVSPRARRRASSARGTSSPAHASSLARRRLRGCARWRSRTARSCFRRRSSTSTSATSRCCGRRRSRRRSRSATGRSTSSATPSPTAPRRRRACRPRGGVRACSCSRSPRCLTSG